MSLNNADDNTMKITMISSLFCGSLAKMITHPFDTVKAKIQVQTISKVFKIRDVIKNTIKNEGNK